MKNLLKLMLLTLGIIISGISMSAQITQRGTKQQEQERLRSEYGHILRMASDQIAPDLIAEVVKSRGVRDIKAEPQLYDGIEYIESENLLICNMILNWHDRPSRHRFEVQGRLYLYLPNYDGVYRTRYKYETASDIMWEKLSRKHLERLEESKTYKFNMNEEYD